MGTNHLKLENLDMTEGALRLLRVLEAKKVITVMDAAVARYEVLSEVEGILGDMDDKMRRMMI